MTEENSPRVLVFGNSVGLPVSLTVLPQDYICGIVVAAIRPVDNDSLQQLAESKNIPFLIQPTPASPEYSEFVDQVKGLNPNYILVNSYAMRLPPELLRIPSGGAFNVHGGLLPRYRGCNPIQWSLINDEKNAGVTMHVMTEDFDAGDIVAQRSVPMFWNDTWREIDARLTVATEDLLREKMPSVLNGSYVVRQQDLASMKYYRHRRPEDGEINWNQSVWSIYNLIRALVHPHPGAFFYEGTNTVILDRKVGIHEVIALKFGSAMQPLPSEKSVGVSLIPNVLVPPGATNPEDAVTFSISSTNTDSSVGSCGLFNIDFDRRESEIKLDIKETTNFIACQKAAVELVLKFAFDELALQRVFLRLEKNDSTRIKMASTIGLKRVPSEEESNGEEVWLMENKFT
jgi:methionyl-tRNA formyltransferase